MFIKCLTVVSFLSALGFGIVALLCLNQAYFLGLLLSVMFLIASIFYCLSSESEKSENVSVYGHPEGNIIKKNK